MRVTGLFVAMDLCKLGSSLLPGTMHLTNKLYNLCLHNSLRLRSPVKNWVHGNHCHGARHSLSVRAMGSAATADPVASPPDASSDGAVVERPNFSARIDFKSIKANLSYHQQNCIHRKSDADPKKIADLYDNFVRLQQQVQGLLTARNENSAAMKVSSQKHIITPSGPYFPYQSVEGRNSSKVDWAMRCRGNWKPSKGKHWLSEERRSRIRSPVLRSS